MSTCHSDWFDRKAKQPVARQDFGGRENAGKVKDGSEGGQPDSEEAGWTVLR